MKRFGIITALALTGCATLAWAANNFGNTTITGTLTVVGNIIADGLSGLETLSLRNNDGAATLSMRSEMPEPEGEGDPIEAYSGIYPTGYGDAVEGEGDDDWAAASDVRPLFEINPTYWDGDSLEDGPFLAMGSTSAFFAMPDFSGAIGVGAGSISLAGDVVASDSVTAESLSTTDGGLSMAKASGAVVVNTDGATDGSGNTSMSPAFTHNPSKNGVSGGMPFGFYQQNDGMGGVDDAYWYFDSDNVFKVESDGDVLIGALTAGDLIVGSGLIVASSGQVSFTEQTNLEYLYISDGSDSESIEVNTNGVLNVSVKVDSGAFRRTESATITAAASITPDCAANDVFDVTADQNITINAPTNFTNAQEITIRWKQNGTGGYTPTWNSAFRFGSLSGTPTSTANATTIFRFLRNHAASKWDCIGVTTGLS